MIALDQLTKWWATSTLVPGTRVPVLGDALGLTLAHNPGAAFSFGTAATPVFAVIAGLAALAIGWFALRTRRRSWAIVLGLLLGGAVTHLADRLFRPPGFGRGEVVDFIAYGNFFIGNVADIVIVGGVVAAVILFVRDSRVSDSAT